MQQTRAIAIFCLFFGDMIANNDLNEIIYTPLYMEICFIRVKYVRLKMPVDC